MERRYPAREKRRPARLGCDAEDGGVPVDVLPAESSRTSELLLGKQCLVWSGSGLSHAAGMSTFSDEKGYYSRAAKRVRIGSNAGAEVSEGAKLFAYRVYLRHERALLALYAQIAREALRSTPTTAHEAIDSAARRKKLAQNKSNAVSAVPVVVRHYTMNVDGLSTRLLSCEEQKTALEDPSSGALVEIHGSILRTACVKCCEMKSIEDAQIRAFASEKPVFCPCCGFSDREHANVKGETLNENERKTKPHLRFGMMLYDDPHGELLVKASKIPELIELDVREVDCILWIGVSFAQSATVGYFRQIERFRSRSNIRVPLQHVIVNTNDTCIWNLLTALHDTHQVIERIIFVRASANEAVPSLLHVEHHPPRNLEFDQFGSPQ